MRVGRVGRVRRGEHRAGGHCERVVHDGCHVDFSAAAHVASDRSGSWSCEIRVEWIRFRFRNQVMRVLLVRCDAMGNVDKRNSTDKKNNSVAFFEILLYYLYSVTRTAEMPFRSENMSRNGRAVGTELN